MSELVQGEGAPMVLTRREIAKILSDNFEKLPNTDKKLFTSAPFYLGGNAALGGLISNSLFRRALNVQSARFISNLPMGVLPFLTTSVLYTAALTQPLMEGELTCPSCCMIRGALIAVAGGVLYPLAMALPLNLILAARHESALLPTAGNRLRFCWDITKPVFNKMRAVLLLQACFGCFLSSSNFEASLKLFHISFRESDEQLGD